MRKNARDSNEKKYIKRPFQWKENMSTKETHYKTSLEQNYSILKISSTKSNYIQFFNVWQVGCFGWRKQTMVL